MLLRLRSACHSLPSPLAYSRTSLSFLFPTSSLCPFYWTIPISINAAISSMCLQSFLYLPFPPMAPVPFHFSLSNKSPFKSFLYCVSNFFPHVLSLSLSSEVFALFSIKSCHYQGTIGHHIAKTNSQFSVLNLDLIHQQHLAQLLLPSLKTLPYPSGLLGKRASWVSS